MRCVMTCVFVYICIKYSLHASSCPAMRCVITYVFVYICINIIDVYCYLLMCTERVTALSQHRINDLSTYRHML